MSIKTKIHDVAVLALFWLAALALLFLVILKFKFLWHHH